MNPRQRHRAFGLLAALLPAFVAGCGESHDDLDAYFDRVRSQSNSDIDPIPEYKPYEEFRYPEDLRTPFRPSRDLAGSGDSGASGAENAPDTERTPQRLERFALDELAYVGLLSDRGSRYALIRDPTGRVNRVGAGDYMGEHYGRVTGVTPELIRMQEKIRGDRGGWRVRETTIKMEGQE